MNTMRRAMSKWFEMPKEILLNLPLLNMVGSEEINIENYKGIIEYSDDVIRINTNIGIIKISGRKLFLKHLTDDGLKIKGQIVKIEFIL